MEDVWKTVSSNPNLRFNPKEIIGKGGFSIVYGGLFIEENGETKKVAVKCIQKGYMNVPLAEQEADLMLKAQNHSNILRYICYTKDDLNLWIVTELCKETLQEWAERKYREPNQVAALTERKILYQVTDGLVYLHRLGIVHRDIKPTNIFISMTGEETKLADFGISRALTANQGDFTNSKWSNPNGTKGWIAPELYHNGRYDFKVDIFPLGCIFGYTLSKEKQHPFGNDPDERSVQIKKTLSPTCLTLEDMKEPYSNDYVALELIQNMIKMDPKERPTAEEVLNHSFFKDYGLNHPVENEATINADITSNYKKMKLQVIEELEQSSSADDDILDQPEIVIVGKHLNYWKNERLSESENRQHNSIGVRNDMGTFSSNVEELLQETNNRESVEELAETSSDVPGIVANVRDEPTIINIDIFGENEYHPSINNGKNIDYGLPQPIEKEGNLSDSAANNHIRHEQIEDTESTGVTENHHENEIPVENEENLRDKNNAIGKIRRFRNMAVSFAAVLVIAIICVIAVVAWITTPIITQQVQTKKLLKLSSSTSKLLDKELDNFIELVRNPGINISARDPKDGMNAMLKLTRNYGHDNLIQLIQLLIENGIDINATDQDGWNALHNLCAYYGHENFTNLTILLNQNNIDIRAKTKEGYSALSLVVLKNPTDVMNWKCHEIFKVLCPSSKKNYETVSRRIYAGFNMMGLSSCDKCSNINAQDSIGRSSCNKGIYINTQDSIGTSSCGKAIDINAQDSIERNVLHLLFQYHNYDPIYQVALSLTDNGADVNAKTYKNKWSPLHVLFRYYRGDNLMDLTELLIKSEVHLNAKTLRGWTPLHFLCRYYNHENLLPVIELLIANKVNLTARTEEGHSASYLLKTRYWDPPKNRDKILEILPDDDKNESKLGTTLKWLMGSIDDSL